MIDWGVYLAIVLAVVTLVVLFMLFIGFATIYDRRWPFGEVLYHLACKFWRL